ncbi:MAG: hypothetical protein O6952_08540, partial [Planctomycetota bacterium]|nr:hypothetical protein [Planctomycetota bacterium]
MKIDREDGMRLQRIGCVLAFVAVAGMVTACSRSGSRRKNQAPSLGAPSGPGLLTGSDPSY